MCWRKRWKAGRSSVIPAAPRASERAAAVLDASRPDIYDTYGDRACRGSCSRVDTAHTGLRSMDSRSYCSRFPPSLRADRGGAAHVMSPTSHTALVAPVWRMDCAFKRRKMRRRSTPFADRHRIRLPLLDAGRVAEGEERRKDARTVGAWPTGRDRRGDLAV